MTQHITQEQANELAAKELFKSRDAFVLYLCNAAIQHYLDQRAKELPVLPPQCEALPKLGESRWDGYERWAKGYGRQCAAHARKLALSEAIAICRRNAQNTSADELEVLKGK